MKIIYSFLLALFLSMGVQAQNCNFITNIGPNNSYVIFTPVGVINPPQYYVQWSFGDGNIQIGSGTPVNHTYANPGVYNVCMTIVDSLTGPVCTTCDTLVLTSCSITYSQNGSLFSFNANGVSPSSNVSWSFGDGTAGNGQAVTHAYNGIGNFTVTMNELDSSGNIICSSTVVINIQGVPNCSFAFIPTSSNGTFQFTGVAGANPNIVWDFGDGSIGFGTNLNHTYTQSGAYLVCMTSYSLIDTCVTCQVVNVTLNPSGCGISSFPDSVNVTQLYMYATGVAPGNIINWTFGDGTSGTGNFVSHIYNSVGTYVVCMNEIDSSTGNILCSTCDSILVSGNQNCNFGYTGLPITNSLQTFTAPFFSGASYTWDFGDGTPLVTGQTVTHAYPLQGVYNVCLSVGQQGAIVCTSCLPLVITNSSPSCQASFISVSVGLNAYFIDQSVAVPINVPPLPSPVNYAWSFGDGNSSSLQFPNHQYSAPGVYIVCLTVSTVGCTSTYCDSIVIDTTINNPIGCNAYFIFTQLSPFNLVGVNLSSGVNLNFSWDFGDGSPLATGAYPSHQYATTGSYVVCLTVSDFLGCSDTYCDTLTVDSLGNILYRGASAGFVLNIYSPAFLTSGVDEANVTQAQLFPNPAADLLSVTWSEGVSNTLTYEVLSIDGRVVLNGSLSRAANSIAVANLNPGFYLLKVRNANGTIESKPFIKQ